MFLPCVLFKGCTTNIYASTDENLLYRYDVTTKDWETLAGESISGKITDVTVNADYIAVSTVDGVWYRSLNSEIPWIKYDFKSDENVKVTSIKMVYPINSYFRDPTYKDWFLATTAQGELYSGFLTDVRGLTRLGSTFANRSAPPILSLAVNGYSKFSARADGLYCEQSWTILNAEWWLRSRFSRAQPCR